MIGVSEERDPAGIKLMRRAGLNPDQYIAVKNNAEELVAMDIKTGEKVIIEKVPVLAGDPGHKNNISSSL
ncbi:hypothetical protein HFM94_05450 [Faecalicatena fissicatena]|uniref:hypothetical protein n=1 Tax=Faecalicatena fissicatena TaxID=290055 RepID=UPI00156FDFDA|nr:hypothetical protein [Faecalicatena fissicatena]NSE32733.1 hypothetical protein [Faecalicatena fissicatena]